MRVLLSAYACETGKGSEPEVGFRTLLAAAAEHEVWVLTRENNIPSLAGFLAGHPHQDRVHLIGFDLGGREQRIKKALGRAGLQWYYNLWQRQVAAVAADLDRDVNFDVIHHVTFASYWTGAGVSSVGKAFVWGPVGGGVEVPIGLIPELGLRGFAEEIARSTIRRMVALSPRVQSSARRAKEVLVQNKDTARRVQTDAAIRIVSNATCVASNVPVTSGERTAEIVVVGRLVPWKAPVLALRALRYVRNEGARLVFYGRGPETKRVQRLARRWGLSERVTFAGFVPRQDLLNRVGTAGALLHPSLHDEAGLAISEALTLGTPVVCLDKGGPAVLTRLWPPGTAAAVAPTTPRRVARDMAAAIDAFLLSPPAVATSRILPTRSFEDEILDAYKRATSTPNNRQ